MDYLQLDPSSNENNRETVSTALIWDLFPSERVQSTSIHSSVLWFGPNGPSLKLDNQ